MSEPLTERQNEAYEFIRGYIRDFSRPPSMKEIGRALGLRSTNAVFKLLRALEKKGYITREPHEARAITLTGADGGLPDLDEFVPRLPLASGRPGRTVDDLRRAARAFLALDRYFLARGRDQDACLLVRAGDDGMHREGIQKGDFVLVEEVPWTALQADERVAAQVGGQTLIRHFRVANEKIHLRPSDRSYTEETFRPDSPELLVIGRVLAVLRRY